MHNVICLRICCYRNSSEGQSADVNSSLYSLHCMGSIEYQFNNEYSLPKNEHLSDINGFRTEVWSALPKV